MKRKLLMVIAVLAIASLLVALLAASSFAEDAITVTYNWHGGSVRSTAKPNEDGGYTLRSEKLSGNGTVTLANGTAVEKEFYGWYDEEGNLYAPGETVYFTKTTMLFEAYGVTVDNAADLKAVHAQCLVRLGADITMDTAFDRDWSVHQFDLNGHTLTSTASSVVSARRSSAIFIGPGKVVHSPATVKTGIDESAIYIYAHGYGDQDAPQQVWIGKGVEFTTPYSLFRCGSIARDNHPKIAISGTVNARALARISPVVVGSTCTIYESANITTSVSFIEFVNQTGIASYMDLSLNGKINVANGNGAIIDEFFLEKVRITVNGGSFCVADSDIENISFYLPDSLMLVEKTEGGLSWKAIVPSDCNHNWIKDNEKSVEPTLESFGLDVFTCELCQKEKSVVTVFDPSNTEITIVVRTTEGEGEEAVTTDTEAVVKAGDVLDLTITGVGENTSYFLTGVKGSEQYPASSIVSIEVPRGVGAIEMKNANSTLEVINITDGADLAITSFAGLTALKTLNVGAATIMFSSVGGNNTLETINSNVAGASITFANSCLDGKTAVKYLNMSNGSTYIFGSNSFRRTSIETLIFPDEATIDFAGDAAFYAATVKYAYFGKSITSIGKKPLDCAFNLEKVVIMSATYVDQYCFCVDGATKATSVLQVYCHSENISFNDNTFVNRQNYGVELYTIDPDITAIKNCTYKVFNGIPHAYFEGIVKEPTCISTGIAGSTTDCVCGVNEVVTYTVYTADGSLELSTEQREIPVSDVHVLGGALSGINYANGYENEGIREYFCGVCGVATLEDPSDVAAPVFEFVGYSAAENGASGIAIGYMVNLELAEEINALDGTTLKYGVFAVSQAVLGDNDVFDGSGNAANGMFFAYTSDLNHAMFEMKIMGFTTDFQKEAKLAIGAFVELTKGEELEFSYIQGKDASDGEKYYFASYNEMIALVK